MLRAVVLALLAAACGRSEGVPDQDLGGLVIEPKRPDVAIDVERATKDLGELTRALLRTHTATIAILGPHTASINSATTVEEAGKVVSDLSDHTTIDVGDDGAFRAVYTNSADYGREAIFTGGKLYLRPRYQRWHGRAPETRDEPRQLRDDFYGPIAATWDLLGHGAELTDRGAVQAAGRNGRKVEVKLSPESRKPPRESVRQREWREGRSLEALAGEVVLDAETGVPLSLQLTGSVGFSRDGRRFLMKIKLDSTLSGIGTVTQVAAPPEGDVVATPGRLREVDDRDTLLQGIAPPSRKNGEGSAAPPPAPAKPPAKKESKP